MRAALAALALALTPAVGLAQSPYESGRNWLLELQVGKTRPAIDAEPGLTGTPYRDVYGDRSMWQFGSEIDLHLFQGFGTVSVGVAASYAWISGHGIVARTGQKSPDETGLRLLPVRALLVYRFDVLSEKLGIPLVPYGKAGLAYTFWWTTRGDGSIAMFRGAKGYGGKSGYQATGGLALKLNFLDWGMARDFDSEFGVNGVFAFAEYTRVTADNFGKGGMDLSDDRWVFGVSFEF